MIDQKLLNLWVSKGLIESVKKGHSRFYSSSSVETYIGSRKYPELMIGLTSNDFENPTIRNLIKDYVEANLLSYGRVFNSRSEAIGLMSHLKSYGLNDGSIHEAVYRYTHAIKEVPICPFCSTNKLKFANKYSKGYHKRCSTKCAANERVGNTYLRMKENEELEEKLKQEIIERNDRIYARLTKYKTFNEDGFFNGEGIYYHKATPFPSLDFAIKSFTSVKLSQK